MLCTAVTLFQHIVKLTNQQNVNYDYSLLPPHIMAKIFVYLKVADLKSSAHVCKSWYFATCDLEIAKRFTVWMKPDIPKMDFLCRPIISIRFHELHFNKFYYRQVIQDFNASITELIIYCDKISHTTIFEMILNLPNLKTFRIYDGGTHFIATNFHRHKKITHHKETIIKHLSRLKSLQVTTLLKDLEPYKLFWRHCTNLKKLYWNRNDKYTEDEYKDFINQFLDPEENLTLKVLTDLSIGNICKKWNSHFFEKMVYINLENIQQLTLGEISSAYYDVMFKEFCKTYQQLISLNLNGCNDRQLYDICQYMLNLKRIELKNCEANNLDEIANLQSLESISLVRIFYTIDDGLLLLLSSKLKYLKRLELNIVSAMILGAICENCKDLEVLKIEQVETKDCEPIYRNLVKLKNLLIRFSEFAKCHSSQIKNSDEWNILRLSTLQKLHISCYVPGITPDLIMQHSILDQSCMDGVWNPTDEDLLQAELTDQHYLNERHDHYVVIVPEVIETFEISDFEWFANSV